ncbi:alpha/beta hydrolase-fold protein [Sphingomonas sp. SUN019]|nr:PHB depolymerase family esterase [Sphingomonas sp. SUN019]UVO50398.1 alpha/beta hydrolase-fold protein [Sphingomonas sp. SUN019]
MRWFLTALALLAAPTLAADRVVEGQTPQAPVTPGNYPYQLFIPKGYSASKQAWPLMIFLHGSGERGADVEKVKLHGPPEIVATHPGFPFILVSPLLEADGDWDTAKLGRLLQQVRKDYRVDPNRIYLTGLSRGGHAAWRWAAERPDLFAAVAPVAGTGNSAIACRLKDMPVWAFHGDNDDIVRPIGSFAMVEAIRQCPGLTAQPVLTIFPATNHNSWDQSYRGDALYRWFLEQRRATPAPKQ